MINKNEFEMLCAIKDNPGLTQRELAQVLDASLGRVNKVHKGLEKAKLVEHGEITPRGMKELEPYKVKNAIIMAAATRSASTRRKFFILIEPLSVDFFYYTTKFFTYERIN